VQNCGTVRPFSACFIADIHAAYGDRSDGSAKVRICKREEQKCARKCCRTQTPHLENSLMECRWKIC